MPRITFQNTSFQISDLSVDDAKTLIDDRWSAQMPASAEDGHWVWQKIVHAANQDYFSETKYLHLPGQVDAEAAIWFQKNARSLLEKDVGAIYIAMLAVAPWNRYSAPKRKLRGLGTLMIRFVVWRSWNLGLKGRIILESLPAAEAFYKRLGLEQVGHGEEGLVQFELPSDKAQALLQGFTYEQ